MGMYSYIKGKFIKAAEEYIIVENNGIGYEVICPFSISSKMGHIGDEITVWLYQSVREDDISLYGLATPEQKDMFLLLITVSGIGPKVAHSICSQLEPDRFAIAVMGGDVKLLTGVKGLGKKGAERIILDLKDKMKQAGAASDYIPSGSVQGVSAPDNSISLDAVSALVVLGYKENDAANAVGACYEEGMDLQELIRRSLKSLTR
ncbi:MAG: Holliday junction branch migration protein RuvA [Clostridiales bacterium]|nr:Holliday junction branch migration protein RuvA [Clostridiales bacterium]